MGVNGRNISFELRILTRLTIDRQHGIENFSTAIGGSFLGLTKRSTNEFCVGCIEFLSKLLDQGHQILFVTAGQCSTATIPITLPPEKSCNLISFGTGVILVELV